METTRQLKFSRLIQKEMSELLQKDGPGYYGSAFVTVTLVRTSPDLSYVKIFLSVMGVKDRAKVVETLNKHQKDVRRRLGIKLKNQIRHIPELSFFLDDSFDYAEKIDKLFQEIKDKENKRDLED